MHGDNNLYMDMKELKINEERNNILERKIWQYIWVRSWCNSNQASYLEFLFFSSSYIALIEPPIHITGQLKADKWNLNYNHHSIYRAQMPPTILITHASINQGHYHQIQRCFPWSRDMSVLHQPKLQIFWKQGSVHLSSQ